MERSSVPALDLPTLVTRDFLSFSVSDAGPRPNTSSLRNVRSSDTIPLHDDLPTKVIDVTASSVPSTRSLNDLDDTRVNFPPKTLSREGRQDIYGNTTPISSRLPQEDFVRPSAERSSVLRETMVVTSGPHQIASTTLQRHADRHFYALCWCLFLGGWNDGSIGPLLPVIQREYEVGFTVVSIIFVVNCTGFICGAFSNVWLNDRLGFGKTIVIGSLSQLIGYAILSGAPPFPLIVLANGFTGLGISLQNAQANGFIGGMGGNNYTRLSLIHAAYGLGAFTSPWIATQFSVLERWSFYFLISLGLAVSNTLVLSLIFRGKTQNELYSESGKSVQEDPTSRDGKYRQILGLRAVHMLALFALLYIGIEVTLGGWIVTFLVQHRHDRRQVGYVSSGFFGGLTLGRVGLMWLNKMIGAHRVVFLYSLVVIGLEITIWVVPSIVENAVAVFLIGLLLGPMFPILVAHAAHVLPRRLLTGGVGWITGMGMTGSAALPFLTGVLASKYGISSMQPLLVSMMCVMTGIWALVPKSNGRID